MDISNTDSQDAVLNRLHALLHRDKSEAAIKPPPEKEVPLLVDIVESQAAEPHNLLATPGLVDPEQVREATDLIQAEIGDRLKQAMEAAFRQTLDELRPRLEELVRQNLEQSARG